MMTATRMMLVALSSKLKLTRYMNAKKAMLPSNRIKENVTENKCLN